MSQTIKLNQGLLMWKQEEGNEQSPLCARVIRPQCLADSVEPEIVDFVVYPYARGNVWKWGLFEPGTTNKIAGTELDPPTSVAWRYWWRTQESAMRRAEKYYALLNGIQYNM